MSEIKILCTLGPSSFDKRVIRRLGELGVEIFRINLSHTKIKDLPAAIDFVRSCTDVPICLDTEGAQIRTGDFVADRIEVRENSLVRGYQQPVAGDAAGFNFYPRDIVGKFRVGDLISIDFNAVLARVIGEEDDAVVMQIVHGGPIGRNKAVTADRDIPLDALSRKDRDAIGIGIDKGIMHYALSFASGPADVDEIRRLAPENAFIIAKIESPGGLANLADIARAADALLIDRGDLSRQLPVERIPRIQKVIIRTAKEHGRTVYVATNLLESMVTQPIPTRAEINDIYNTLLDGADGLVLAAETAIGQHPVACASMVARIIHEYESRDEGNPLAYPMDPVSMLVPPHGGQLVQRHAGAGEREAIARLPKLLVSDATLLDCEQIAHGTYSPLTGFMGRETIESVIESNCLPDGTVWSMPILLPAPKQSAGFVAGDRLVLVREGDDTVYAYIDVTETFTLDVEQLSEKWFGTSSSAHPGVARLLDGGNRFIAGEVTLVERLRSPHSHYVLMPNQSRFIFAHKGWSKVIGFHTRNPIHRAHEYIQIKALDDTGADGLYINPVLGPKKAGDFLPGPIMRSYQAMLDLGLFPTNKVVLGGFATYSRYAGPREAVFTALCRKNMGCSHFIIGRDHTGVGNFYESDANRRFIEGLGDLGIAPVFFDTIAYDPATDRYAPVNSKPNMLAIDGTRIRQALRDNASVPDWMMRDVVQDVLRSELAAESTVFDS
ncbi:MAG: pyruvate kinase [Rhodospirillales bacterium]